MPLASTKPPRLRVVVDSNAWISSFLNPDSLVGQRLARLRHASHIQLFFSADLRGEVLEVLQRPKFKKYFFADDQRDYLFRVHSYSAYAD